jgi:triacylglycerol esterase/lipase EstA (alpha/beta hydrolase family)
VNDPKVTSYDFADEILRKLADKSVFPNLKQIVLAGHSAGGQFVTRYEMSNKVHNTLGVPISLHRFEPSSYAYLDTTRPTASTTAATAPRSTNGPTASTGAPATPPTSRTMC